jgi:amidohydrolase
VGAQVIGGLQAIVSRQMELTKNAVVITTTIFKGGVRENIIPEEATLGGTIRTLDTAMRADIKRRIAATATNIAEASGATATVSFKPKTSIVYNDPLLVQQMLPSLQKAAGGNVVEMDAVTGAEDFSFFAEQVPSLFFYLGGRPANIDEKDAAPHHTPKFYVDEKSMQTGILAFCQLVIDYPKAKK